MKKYKAKLQVGSLDSKKVETAPAPQPQPEADSTAKEKVVPSAEPGQIIVPAPGPAAATVEEPAEALDSFGSLIPFADPNWYQSYHSPYYNESHAALRAEVREWVDTELEPYVTEWEEAKKVPDTIYKQMGEKGYLAGLMGVHYPTHLTKNVVKSVKPEEWDLFHEMLLTDELSRTGSGGLVWNLIGGFGIGCPPVVKFGKKPLVNRILPDILNGEKRICLVSDLFPMIRPRTLTTRRLSQNQMQALMLQI